MHFVSSQPVNFGTTDAIKFVQTNRERLSISTKEEKKGETDYMKIKNS